MKHKNQIIVFAISFLIAGFFLLTIVPLSHNANAQDGFVCCDLPGDGFNTCDSGEACVLSEGEVVCTSEQSSPDCSTVSIDTQCTCLPPPAIPTLNQWGKIITMVVIGLFGVIGIFAMRRRSAVTS